MKRAALVTLGLGALVAAALAIYHAGCQSAFVEVATYCEKGCRMWVTSDGWLQADKGAGASCPPSWRF